MKGIGNLFGVILFSIGMFMVWIGMTLITDEEIRKGILMSVNNAFKL